MKVQIDENNEFQPIVESLILIKNVYVTKSYVGTRVRYVRMTHNHSPKRGTNHVSIGNSK